MLLSDRTQSARPSPSSDLFMSILDHTEMGVLVVDSHARMIFINATACRLLGSAHREMPQWMVPPVLEMIERMRATGEQVVEKCQHDDVTYRIRARGLHEWSGHIVLEISIAHAAEGQQVAELLARSLKLSRSDAGLLELLWRGMSNEEIADKLGVRIGTVKSRLFRLYQKLGVRRRPAAVLRAAEVISS
jgi:ATP/maltotriose-dependent transcriptional regulator MalT